MKKGKTGAAGGSAKILIYGATGAGKTTLAATVPPERKPLIISLEAGTSCLTPARLKALAEATGGTYHAEPIEAWELDAAKVRQEWKEAVSSVEPGRLVIVDSVSDLSANLFRQLATELKDGRQYYPAFRMEMSEILRGVRSLPNTVVCLCAEGKQDDEYGGKVSAPNMQDKEVTANVGYFFDAVGQLAIGVDAENKPFRYLRFGSDGRQVAKDRGGMLDAIEPPSLGFVLGKMEAAS